MKPLRLLQRGFSLVELMVGVALTMVIAVALLTLMTNVSRNNTEMLRTNSVIENGRFTLQLLESDISLGGFWAGYVPKFDDITLTSAAPTDFPAAVPDPCPIASGAWEQPATWTADYKNQLVTVPIAVYQVGADGISPVCAGTSSLQGPLYGTTSNPVVQPFTDIIVVRHAAPCVAVTPSSATDNDCKDESGNVFFQYGRCSNGFALSANTADLNMQKGDCTTTADKYRFVSTIYWVRNYFATAGDGIPTLVRTRFQTYDDSGTTKVRHTGSETLVDGIEALRVQLGVDNVSKPTSSSGTGGTTLQASHFAAVPCFNDTCSAVYTNTYTPRNRGDGNADTYLTCTDSGTPCSTLFNLANTVSVKLYVLARASSTTPGHSDSKTYCLNGSCGTGTVNCSSPADKLTRYGPYCDGYKRQAYTQTVRMMNISMRREVPATW